MFFTLWALLRFRLRQDYGVTSRPNKSGKPGIPHILRYRGAAVGDYSFTLDALNLRHPELLRS